IPVCEAARNALIVAEHGDRRFHPAPLLVSVGASSGVGPALPFGKEPEPGLSAILTRSRRMLNRLRPLAVLLLVASMAAPPARAADTAPVEVPVLAALSGPLAFYGQAVAKGLEMLTVSVNKQGGVNGRPIKFVILDQQSNPQVSAQLMSQQIAK